MKIIYWWDDNFLCVKWSTAFALKVHSCSFESLTKSSSLYDEDFTLKHLLLFEICAREICEKFAYKHSETIENVKN